jgi:hypothetical protein
MSAKKRTKPATPKSKKSPTGKRQPLRQLKPLVPVGKPAGQRGTPTGAPGQVDVTFVPKEDIPIDPYITEGHRGYEETGPSEPTYLARAAKKGARGKPAKRGARTSKKHRG